MTALKWQVDPGRESAWSWPDGSAEETETGPMASDLPSSGRRVPGSPRTPGVIAGVRPLRETGRWRLGRSGPANPLRCALFYAGLPVLLLVVYVSLWTAAMHYGYRKQQLDERIAQLRIDNDSLQAEVREAQSSRVIVPRAVALGMVRADPELLPVGQTSVAGRK